MVFVVLLYVEIHRAVALVGIAVVENLLHQFLLLHDVTCGMRLNAWRQHVECLHRLVIAVGIVLRYLHRLQLLQTCLLCNLVVAVISIVLQVSHIGDVSHIAHLIAKMLQVAEHNVKSHCRTGVTQMRVTINRRSTHIHAHIGCMQRLKALLAARKSVIYQQILLHNLLHYILQRYEKTINPPRKNHYFIHFIQKSRSMLTDNHSSVMP